MMKKTLTLILLVGFINLFFCPLSFANDFLLESGTKVRLKLMDKVTSGLNNEGNTVNFQVVEDVKQGDTVLIKEGTRATGTISELIPRGRIGKAGQLHIYLDSTQAVNRVKVPLNGTIDKKGDDKVILSVALSILLAPPGLFFLLMRGSDAQLPVGYQFSARVDRDVTISLDDAKSL